MHYSNLLHTEQGLVDQNASENKIICGIIPFRKKNRIFDWIDFHQVNKKININNCK